MVAFAYGKLDKKVVVIFPLNLCVFCCCRDFNQLVRGDGATLDRPRFTIEDAFAIAPVDVKLSPDGTKVAASSVDNSLRVFSLQEESKEQQQ